MSDSPETGPITDLLAAWEDGVEGAAEELVPRIYDRLCRIAARWHSLCAGDPVLQPTALAHEAFLRLAACRGARWESSEHFLACAATTIRRVALDHHRAQQRLRRGGGWERVELGEEIPGRERCEIDRLALDQALARLAEKAPRAAAIVALHAFAGWSVAETAEKLGCGTATVSRDWRFARTWLVRQLR